VTKLAHTKYSSGFSGVTFDLKGKVALVTGAGEGVGRALALRLAAAGAAVGVNDINPDRADALAETITNAGGRALPWAADISNKFQMAGFIETMRDSFTHLHLFVNAAGVLRASSFLKLDDYDWRRILEVNLTAAFYGMQLAGRVMAEEGGGAILNLASVYGLARTRPNQAAYVASKAGLIALTRQAAGELAPLKVRVNALCVAEIEEDGAESTPTNPMQRLGTPDEAAAMGIFLLSEAASFITGQAVCVDGGLSGG